MYRRGWNWSVLISTILTAVPVLAQEEIRVSPQLRISVKDMRDLRKEINQKEIDEAARQSVMRLTDDVNRGLKTGKTPTPMHQIVREAAEFVLEAPVPPKRLDEKQIAYVDAVGKAFIPPLREVLIGTKDKPSKFEPLVKINAARILSAAAKSGYANLASVACDIIEDPKEHDSVKLYALQALKHLFSAASSENVEKSTFTDLALEKRAIKALIDFVGRPLPIPKDAPAEEIEAFHYVRREAIRALGSVRHPIIRKDKTVEMSPAHLLLRLAIGDPSVQPPPNLPERAEALIGYLQLAPDREQQMDYSAYFVGVALRNFVAEFNARKDPNVFQPPPAAPGAPPPQIPTPAHRDYHPWRLNATRLIEVLRAWKTNWEVNSPQPPEHVAKIVSGVTQQGAEDLLPPLTASGKLPGSVNLQQFDLFLKNQAPTVTSKSMFRDDPKSVLQLPGVQ